MEHAHGQQSRGRSAHPYLVSYAPIIWQPHHLLLQHSCWSRLINGSRFQFIILKDSISIHFSKGRASECKVERLKLAHGNFISANSQGHTEFVCVRPQAVPCLWMYKDESKKTTGNSALNACAFTMSLDL